MVLGITSFFKPFNSLQQTFCICFRVFNEVFAIGIWIDIVCFCVGMVILRLHPTTNAETCIVCGYVVAFKILLTSRNAISQRSEVKLECPVGHGAFRVKCDRFERVAGSLARGIGWWKSAVVDHVSIEPPANAIDGRWKFGTSNAESPTDGEVLTVFILLTPNGAVILARVV